MSPFQYSKISTYLRAYLNLLPGKGRGEASRIAGHLGVSSTLVSQVLNESKTFTAEQTAGLCDYLGLRGIEREYLFFLTQFERAGSPETRKFWRDKLDEFKRQALSVSKRLQPERVLSETERSVFYSNALYSAIRLYCSVGSAGKNLVEVTEHFDQPRAKVATMLKFLVDTGLCREEKGQYFMGAQSTHLEAGSPHLSRHYANWRLRAIQHGESLSEEELMYSAPVSLSRADFQVLRERMVGVIKEFLATVHDSPAEDVACFNLDLFWVKR